jgi:hypothetical protein
MERKGAWLKKGGMFCFVIAIISSVKAISDLLIGNGSLPKDPDVRVSFVVGQLLLPLICVILGLYLHQKAQKYPDQTKKGIGYYILLSINIAMVLFFCVACVLVSKREKSAASALAKAVSDPNSTFRISCDEFSFQLPQGWISHPPDSPSRKAILYKPMPPSRKPAAMIYIEAGRSVESTVDATAQGLTLAWGGNGSPNETIIDHVRALYFRAPYKGSGLNPIEGLVAHRNGRVYMIMGGIDKGQSLGNSMETIRDSWRWNSPASSEDPNSASEDLLTPTQQ